MERNMYSIDDIRGVVESEGLGYAVQHYLSADSIEDEKLKELWKKAADYLNYIDDYLDNA